MAGLYMFVGGRKPRRSSDVMQQGAMNGRGERLKNGPAIMPRECGLCRKCDYDAPPSRMRVAREKKVVASHECYRLASWSMIPKVSLEQSVQTDDVRVEWSHRGQCSCESRNGHSLV